jgi:hypothetical protein
MTAGQIIFHIIGAILKSIFVLAILFVIAALLDFITPLFFVYLFLVSPYVFLILLIGFLFGRKRRTRGRANRIRNRQIRPNF